MDQHLKQSLQDLQGKLEHAGPVDEEFRGLLQRLDGDIQALLERRQAAEPEQSTTYGLAERAQELSAKFAAQHPTLEPALRELGRILSNMGI
jgi:predicted nuclease with TOPRIM domain